MISTWDNRNSGISSSSRLMQHTAASLGKQRSNSNKNNKPNKTFSKNSMVSSRLFEPTASSLNKQRNNNNSDTTSLGNSTLSSTSTTGSQRRNVTTEFHPPRFLLDQKYGAQTQKQKNRIQATLKSSDTTTTTETSRSSSLRSSATSRGSFHNRDSARNKSVRNSNSSNNNTPRGRSLSPQRRSLTVPVGPNLTLDRKYGTKYQAPDKHYVENAPSFRRVHRSVSLVKSRRSVSPDKRRESTSTTTPTVVSIVKPTHGGQEHNRSVSFAPTTSPSPTSVVDEHDDQDEYNLM